MHAVDDKGNSVLHYEPGNLAFNSQEVFEFLIHQGADPAKLNTIQSTVLHIATRQNNI